jgi:nucleoside-diphosphate-sugar epimerase
MRILVTGFNGYLANELIRNLSRHDIVLYRHDVRDLHMYSDIDMILHFASPSDNEEFNDIHKTSTTIIDGTMNMVKIAQANKCKLVYASTMGVYNPLLTDTYCICKAAMDNYIRSVYNNYIILRIPRVYSKCRKKGLMKQIKNKSIPESDYNNVIKFISLESFVQQTLPVLTNHNQVLEYDVNMSMSIREIEQWVTE